MPSTRAHRSSILVLLALATACGDLPPALGQSTVGTTTHASGTTTREPTGDPEPSSDTAAVDETGSVPIDQGLSPWECEPTEPDCPPGEKCMLWNRGGDDRFDASHCTPIVDDPAAVGEPCTVVEGPFSGLDDCDFGALCWNVDRRSLEGTCYAYCMAPGFTCEDPTARCAFAEHPPGALCIPHCNPLAQDCGGSSGCYPQRADFTCAPDASGGLGAPGEPCEFSSSCDPGVVCVGPDFVPPGYPCEDASGCCTALCDLFDPMPPCLPGQGCVPWYEEGTAPVGYEAVGVCAAA